MLPTYNEAGNIRPLVEAILAHGEDWQALVVDDNSPDGTWKIVAEMAESNPRVHLLHRKKDKGRGLAGIAGFRRAIELGADWVLEMDADFSHDPRHIPEFVEAARASQTAMANTATGAAERQGADIIVGSRRVAGGGERGRSAVRGWITAFASFYIGTVLGLPLRDPTSGYRLFSRRVLEALPWDAMRATGPEIVQEVLVAARMRGFKMIEIPIMFEERREGESTFNARIMIRSFFSVLGLRLFAGRLKP